MSVASMHAETETNDGSTNPPVIALCIFCPRRLMLTALVSPLTSPGESLTSFPELPFRLME